MDTELRPLLPRAMSACAAGCGPSALAALQTRDLKAFKSALDEEDFDVEKKHLVDGVDTTLLQLAVEAAHGKDEFVETLVLAGAAADKQDPVLETVVFHGPAS